MKNIKRGFTLAEVLITLTILGVVAAITVPSIRTNVRKRETITKLQFVYSLLTKVVEESEAIYGDSDKWNYNNASLVRERILVPIIGKESGNGNRQFECVGSFDGMSDINYYGDILDMDGKTANAYGNMCKIAKDGLAISISTNNGYNYARVRIDLDGPKKGKNQLGNDIFDLYLTDGWSGVKDKNPRFHQYTVEWKIARTTLASAKKGCVQDKNAASCYAYIMFSGWKIPSDYPIKNW